ncbi:MAG: acyltransferase [Flavobacterium sp.]|nr:acyltransferase [Flavobacterium sp.]
MNLNRLSIIFLNVLKLSVKLNLWSTIYFNFKVLPFHQAVKLPFHFFGKTDFADLSGKFIIQAKEVHFGMIVFGGKHEVVISSNVPTRIFNSGIIEFNSNVKFARGINVMVWNNGVLSIGDNFSIGSLSRIICFRKMSFGNDVLIAWECQFFDTDFHFIQEKDQSIKDNCGTVMVEDETWIGARSTILKNTTIPKNSIVGANSICSGNYREKNGEGILLAGIPAKVVKTDVSYIIDKKQEQELFAHFSKNQNQILN